MHAAIAKPVYYANCSCVGRNHRTQQPFICTNSHIRLPGTVCCKSLPASRVRAGLDLSRQRAPRQTPNKRAVIINMATSDATDSKAHVAFLGIGIMGLGMVRRLLGAGFDVTVWNRSVDKCEPLRKDGAHVAPSAEEAVAGADITFVMLADPAAALAVAKQAAKGLSKGKGYVDVSTVDPGTAQQIAELVRATGAEYLEAPVSGSKAPAEQGKLIFLAGGEQALFERAGPMLDAMGKAKFFLGEVGAGAHMKLVVNMMMGSMMATTAEGLALAAAVGLKQQDLIKVIELGTMAMPMFKLKAPTMVKGEYPVAFPLKHQQKDIRLALEEASEAGLKLPVAAAANKLYMEAKAKGHGDDDFSAVLEIVQNPTKA